MQDSGQQTVNLSGISAGPFESQLLSIVATSDNQTLIPDPVVNGNDGSSATGSLAYTPAAGQIGNAMITVTVRDAGLDGSLNSPDDATFFRTFNVLVLSPDAVNSAPSFEGGGDQQATDEHGLITVTGWAKSISPGPLDEASQSVNFLVTTDNDGLFFTKPAVDASGKLTFRPLPNARGVRQVTLRLNRTGGLQTAASIPAARRHSISR